MHRSLIVEKLNTSSMSLTDLAQKIGFDQNLFTRFIAGKIELDFETVLKIVQEIAPEQEFEIMKLYIESIEGTDNLICAMEYCSSNRMLELMALLLDKLSESSNNADKAWHFLYECVYEYHLRKHSDDHILEKVENFNACTPEMGILKNILIMYLYHYNLKKYKRSLEISRLCTEDLYFVAQSYLKNSFRMRLHQVLAHLYLMLLGDVNLGREHSLPLINNSHSRVFQVNGCIWMGISYFFESYDESLKYFKVAKELAQLIGRSYKLIEDNIIFLNNYWGYQNEKPKTEEVSEIAHFLIRKGNVQEALNILDEIEDTPFRLYYRWLATKDPIYLYKSMDMFSQSKSTFYLRNMIEPELSKAGLIS